MAIAARVASGAGAAAADAPRRLPGRATTTTQCAMLVGTARPRKIQGHDQRADAVRRSPPGHRSQPRGHRLDRGAAQELRLHEHRAHQVRLPAAAGPRRRQPARGGRRWPRRRTRRGAAAAADTRRRARPCRSGRQHDLRQSRAHGRQQRSRTPARRQAARAQRAADDAGPARRGLLHQDRHDASRRDVHRRRAHGRPSAGAKPPTTTARARRW